MKEFGKKVHTVDVMRRQDYVGKSGGVKCSDRRREGKEIKAEKATSHKSRNDSDEFLSVRLKST